LRNGADATSGRLDHAVIGVAVLVGVPPFVFAFVDAVCVIATAAEEGV
jgi:hypothetical protein